MKRIINNRPICNFALMLVVGIIIGESLATLNPYFRLIPLSVGALLFIGCLYISNCKKYCYLVISFVLGILLISGANDIFMSKSNGYYYGNFSGIVASEIIVEDGISTFYIDDIETDGEKIDGKSYVMLGYEIEPNFGAGDKVKIFGNLNPKEHNSFDSYYAYAVAKDVVYFSKAQSVSKIEDLKQKFPLSLQIKIKKMFYENTNESTASICQALILGDKRAMNDNLYDNIKRSGLAHILAISGLHITALVSALYFVLRKCKLKEKTCFIIVTIITFFFVWLCSFSPSSVRAFIMVFVFCLASILGVKKDHLSTLAFAAIILLFFRPTSIMDIGFLLSISSVLGIILWFSAFKNVGLRLLKFQKAEPNCLHKTNNYKSNSNSKLFCNGECDYYSNVESLMIKDKDALACGTLSLSNGQFDFDNSKKMSCNDKFTISTNNESGLDYNLNQDSSKVSNIKNLNENLTKEQASKKTNSKLKRKWHKFLKNTVDLTSVSLSTNLMIYPFVAYFFGAVPTLFLISNLIIMPYMVIAFLVLLVVTTIALTTTLYPIVAVMDILILPFKAFVNFIGTIPFSMIPASISILGIITFYLCMFILSKFVFLPKYKKFQIVSIILSISLAISTIL